MDDVVWPDPQHMLDRHGVKLAEAQEALRDEARVLVSPDPASRSGASDRVIGFSDSRQELLCVILVREDGVTYGANAWPATSKWRRIYEGRS